jgi:hypothetical protein
MAKTKPRRQMKLRGAHASDRVLGWTVGDQLEVVAVRKLQHGTNADGDWWLPEIITVRAIKPIKPR